MFYYYSPTEIMLLLLLNIILSVLIARYIGAKRNIGFGWSLFFCLLLSPLLGLLITLLSGKKLAA